jgi:uncharacterized membrane protein YfcA
MNLLTMEAVIAAASVLAGFLGALTGLGGGVIVVPLLVLAFGVDIRYAIGVSLICVIATSSGAAAAYVREGFTNVRIGMLLEVATTIGALTGAWVTLFLAKNFIGELFGAVLIFSAYYSTRKKSSEEFHGAPDWFARKFALNGVYPSDNGLRSYNITGVPFGFALMYLAGVLSALLGIGSGAVKVLAMDNIMKMPFKVSTTTSNFMIGVTAAASSGVYLGRGYIDPTLAAPAMLGILLGSFLGAKALSHLQVSTLRLVFAAVVGLVGVEMIYKGFTGML